MKNQPGQLNLFAPQATTADEAQTAAAQRKPRPGSPREWTERVARGLCGVCGVRPRQALQARPDDDEYDLFGWGLYGGLE